MSEKPPDPHIPPVSEHGTGRRSSSRLALNSLSRRTKEIYGSPVGGKGHTTFVKLNIEDFVNEATVNICPKSSPGPQLGEKLNHQVEGVGPIGDDLGLKFMDNGVAMAIDEHSNRDEGINLLKAFEGLTEHQLDQTSDPTVLIANCPPCGSGSPVVDTTDPVVTSHVLPNLTPAPGISVIKQSPNTNVWNRDSAPRVATMNVSYQWKPAVCNYCKVFGHSPKRVYQWEKKKPSQPQSAVYIEENQENAIGNNIDEDGFVKVSRKHRRPRSSSSDPIIQQKMGEMHQQFEKSKTHSNRVVTEDTYSHKKPPTPIPLSATPNLTGPAPTVPNPSPENLPNLSPVWKLSLFKLCSLSPPSQVISEPNHVVSPQVTLLLPLMRICLEKYGAIKADDQVNWEQGEWEFFHYQVKLLNIDPSTCIEDVDSDSNETAQFLKAQLLQGAPAPVTSSQPPGPVSRVASRHPPSSGSSMEVDPPPICSFNRFAALNEDLDQNHFDPSIGTGTNFAELDLHASIKRTSLVEASSDLYPHEPMNEDGPSSAQDRTVVNDQAAKKCVPETEKRKAIADRLSVSNSICSEETVNWCPGEWDYFNDLCISLGLDPDYCIEDVDSDTENGTAQFLSELLNSGCPRTNRKQ
ncbi:hypothetical protein L1987_87003 [Smallanthus sonchifolius]|uniref:Uncharacterized protein n=1 Tax=Smallanthus sonchifolius TaxID=185202 RepID=A0ACB8Y1M9_9ASTR|nr:hypothetical protein L1987_87003 [Smallanthus sonchifolius]